MQYRTIENTDHVCLRRERRSVVQTNEFPLEDLNGHIIIKERRATPDSSTEGMDVTEAKISQAEFQEYFDVCQKDK